MCVLPVSVLTAVAVVICPAVWCEENTAQVVAQLQQQVSALLQQVQVLTEAKANDRKEIEELKKYVHKCPTSASDKRTSRQIYPVGGVGFTACVGVADFNVGAHQTILFDRTLTNEGDAYRNTTGIFRAPSDGLYVFHVSAMEYPNKHMYLTIMRDGVVVDDVLTDATGDHSWETSSELWVLRLLAGNEVWIRSSHSGNVHGGCHTMFSGFQLYGNEG